MDIPIGHTIFWERLSHNFWIKSGGSLGGLSVKEETKLFHPTATQRREGLTIVELTDTGFFENAGAAERAHNQLHAMGFVHHRFGQSLGILQ